MTRETTEDVDYGHSKNTDRTVSTSAYVVSTSRALSPDGAWPERWLSGMIEMGRVGLGTT